jgi:hypothetical protein
LKTALHWKGKANAKQADYATPIFPTRLPQALPPPADSQRLK